MYLKSRKTGNENSPFSVESRPGTELGNDKVIPAQEELDFKSWHLLKAGFYQALSCHPLDSIIGKKDQRFFFYNLFSF